MKRFVLALAALGALVAAAIGIFFLRQPAPSYLKLSLGMPMPKVIYAVGPPSSLGSPDAGRSSTGDDETVNASSVSDDARAHYLKWEYGKAGQATLTFDQKNRLLKKIECIDLSSIAPDKQKFVEDFGDFQCPPLQGVTAGMTEGEVTNLLGEPSTDTGGAKGKIITYARTGAVFTILSGKVISLALDQDAK